MAVAGFLLLISWLRVARAPVNLTPPYAGGEAFYLKRFKVGFVRVDTTRVGFLPAAKVATPGVLGGKG